MAINGFNIDSFKSNYTDLGRAYTFLVLLNNSFGSLSTEKVKYLVNASSLPASTIDVAEVNWQGNIFPLATTHLFEDWTITFKHDDTAQLRKDLIKWHEAIHDPKTNIHGSPVDYMLDQEVWHLNSQGDPIMKYKLVSAWPSTVGEMTLDYSSKEVATFDLTFKFLRYEIIG